MEPNITNVGRNRTLDLSVSIFSDDRYLAAYDLPGSKQGRGSCLWDWKKIAAASALGVCLGLGSAAVQMTDSSPAQEIVKAQPKTKSKPVSSVVFSANPSAPRLAEKHLASMMKPPEPASALSEKEAARLKARNRRLEALISLLRQRAHAPERKPAQDQIIYIGQ